MAFVMMTPLGKSMSPVVFLNHLAVGHGCANRRDDVALIQLLLRIIALSVFDSKNIRPGDEAELKVDGVCGPKTVAYIRNFQRQGSADVSQDALRMVEDGFVSPVVSGSPWTSTGHALTIIRMNRSFAGVVGGSNPHASASLWGMPKFLQDKLFMR